MKVFNLKLSLNQREAIWAYIFITPWIIGFIVFTLGPMIASLYYSFTNFNIISPPVWRGIANFKKIFLDDPLFWHSLQVTIKYASMALPLHLLIGFSIAVLLNQKIFAVNVWRTMYFLPSVVAGVAVALLWVRIFNTRIGLLNPFLKSIGISNPPGWLQDPDWAVPALVIMSLWSVGGGMIIYLAGLQGIPTALYEAATIDGANVFQKFWKITVPMMTPVIFYNVVLGLIGAFNYFTEVYVATNGTGGPVRSTLFYNLYLYQNAFKFFNMGYASGLAWVLFLIVLVVTLLVFRSSPYWVYYEGELRK